MGDQPAVERSPLLRHPLAVGFALFVLFGALHVLAQAAGFLLLGFLAVLVATLFSYPIDLFARFMPRVLALIVTIVLLVGVAIGAALIAIPIITTRTVRFRLTCSASGWALTRLRAARRISIALFLPLSVGAHLHQHAHIELKACPEASRDMPRNMRGD